MKHKLKLIFFAILTLIVTLGIVFYMFFFVTLNPSDIEFEIIDLPKSPIQHTNGTWWGYNKGKVVRHDDTVYTYYIDNESLNDGEPNADNPSRVVLIKINPDLSVVEFDSLWTSRTPALCIDSSGRLLVSNFEPTSSEDNGSEGKLMLYTYTFNMNGEFKRVEETVIPQTEEGPAVNFRYGMAIDDENNLMIAFGTTLFENNSQNHVVLAYVRAASDQTWRVHLLAENLEEDNYYTYPLINGLEDLRALNVQDACFPEMTQFDYPCFYQHVRYYENGLSPKIIDYSHLDIAKDRPQLIEHTGFHLASDGNIHIMTRAWIDGPPNPYKGTFDYITGDIEHLEKINTDYLSSGFNWLRFFELNGDVFMVGTTFNKVGIIDPYNQVTYWLDIPKNDIKGSYLFTNAKRTGSDTNKYLDLYLVPGTQEFYNHSAKYIRIDLTELNRFLMRQTVKEE
ncbi:MAG: hypothetical protein JEZ08_01070 [Clostridiales bacterium]|nr:hypothetical protein [Clostridiales bacterium]